MITLNRVTTDMKQSDRVEGGACRQRQDSRHAKMILMAAEQSLFHRK